MIKGCGVRGTFRQGMIQIKKSTASERQIVALAAPFYWGWASGLRHLHANQTIRAVVTTSITVKNV
jgi:hypothetical protein